MSEALTVVTPTDHFLLAVWGRLLGAYDQRWEMTSTATPDGGTESSLVAGRRERPAADLTVTIHGDTTAATLSRREPAVEGCADTYETITWKAKSVAEVADMVSVFTRGMS
jgi:hypothetical protein